MLARELLALQTSSAHPVGVVASLTAGHRLPALLAALISSAKQTVGALQILALALVSHLEHLETNPEWTLSCLVAEMSLLAFSVIAPALAPPVDRLHAFLNLVADTGQSWTAYHVPCKLSIASSVRLCHSEASSPALPLGQAQQMWFAIVVRNAAHSTLLGKILALPLAGVSHALQPGFAVHEAPFAAGVQVHDT